MDPMHVLVVDDSAVVRQAMTMLLAEPGVTVTVAADPLIALEKMRRARPDVIVLDLELPRMDGLTFLRLLMAEDPIPVVICSGLAGPGTHASMRALEEGAVDIVVKPQLGVKGYLEQSAAALRQTVRGAARARVGGRSRAPAGSIVDRARLGVMVASGQVIAIGASTGGPEALSTLLAELPADCPGLAIVQHMPEQFTSSFARRLDGVCAIRVKEAEDGDRVLQGQALIAPGNRHLRLVRSGAHYRVSVVDEPPVGFYRPSVDVLFESAARAAGPHAVGVILTGMGNDGASGLSAMKEIGAHTIAQDEASCAVFGMPREAIAKGAAHEVLPLAEIPRAMLRASKRGPRS